MTEKTVTEKTVTEKTVINIDDVPLVDRGNPWTLFGGCSQRISSAASTVRVAVFRKRICGLWLL